MQEGEFFLCSELMEVSAGPETLICNLEQISPAGCVVALDASLPVGTGVQLRCLSCPRRKRSCIGCRFKGRVRSEQRDPLLGCLTQIEFDGRIWSEKEWRPGHLTNIKRYKSKSY